MLRTMLMIWIKASPGPVTPIAFTAFDLSVMHVQFPKYTKTIDCLRENTLANMTIALLGFFLLFPPVVSK